MKKSLPNIWMSGDKKLTDAILIVLPKPVNIQYYPLHGVTGYHYSITGKTAKADQFKIVPLFQHSLEMPIRIVLGYVMQM